MKSIILFLVMSIALSLIADDSASFKGSFSFGDSDESFNFEFESSETSESSSESSTYESVTINGSISSESEVEAKNSEPEPVVVKEEKKEEPKPEVKQAMSKADFRDLLMKLEDEVFEDTMLKIQKTALKYNYINSSQLCKIVETYMFDQVKAAKLGYPKVIDKENIYKIFDVIDFYTADEEEDFQDWIDSQP